MECAVITRVRFLLGCIRKCLLLTPQCPWKQQIVNKNLLLLCISLTTWQQKVILLYPYDQLQVYVHNKMTMKIYDGSGILLRVLFVWRYEQPYGTSLQHTHTLHIVLRTARLALQSILVLWISSNMRPNGVINSKHFSSESKANSCTTKLRGKNGR